MTSKLLLWASVLISAPSSVMGLHRLDRLRSSILDMSTDTNTNTNTNTVKISANANANADMGLYTGAHAEFAKAQRIAKQLDQEMYTSLMETGTEQQVNVDAIYNEKRIGIEVEYQDAPRVIVAVNPNKITAMKAEFTGTGKYAGLGADKWLYASAIPLRYGNSWLQSNKDSQNFPYWKVTTDNEKTPLTQAEKDFWAPVIAKQTEVHFSTPDEALDNARASMNNFCGLNAAMELVTIPLETTADVGGTPNYVFVMQAMRVWTQTLRRFTYKSAKAADKGLAEDAMLVANEPNVDFKKVICKAMGGDIANLDKVQGKWLGQKNHYIVPHFKVTNAFADTLLAMDQDKKPWKGISAYDFVDSYLEGFLWIPKGDFPFTLLDETDHFYSRYFLFPKLANAAATDTVPKIMKTFGFGPQLNFGFPVSRFGADDSAATISALQTAARNPKNGYQPFTSTIWPWVLSYGNQLYEAVIEANNVLYDGGTVWTAAQARDTKGFMTLFLHYYFIDGYLGLHSDKFAHSLLLKSPLNDVLRSLSFRSKRAIGAWWDSFAGTDACFSKVDLACAEIYTRSNIAALDYPIPWAKLGDAGKEQRIANAKRLISDVFESITTDDASRWGNERARVITAGVVATTTRYGELMAGINNENPYPVGRTAVSPISKTVPPFFITAAGIQRPAVLIEHRDGNAISSTFGNVWVDSEAAANPAALKALVDAQINALLAFQTPVLLEQSSQSHGPKVDTKNKLGDFTRQQFAAFKSNKVLDDDTLTLKLDQENKPLVIAEPQKNLPNLLADAKKAKNPFAWDNNNPEEKRLKENLKKIAAEIIKQCEALLKRQSAKEKLNPAEIQELTENCGPKKKQ